MVQLKFKEAKEPYIEGNFDFELSDVILDKEEFIPKRKISFDWCVEVQQDVETFNANEMLAEKLKQDFLKLLNKK